MKMNKHYNELKASYLFVDIAHKVARIRKHTRKRRSSVWASAM